jgi:hypothetical protein
VIQFDYVVVVRATEKPAEKSAGFCLGGGLDLPTVVKGLEVGA